MIGFVQSVCLSVCLLSSDMWLGGWGVNQYEIETH